VTEPFCNPFKKGDDKLRLLVVVSRNGTLLNIPYNKNQRKISCEIWLLIFQSFFIIYILKIINNCQLFKSINYFFNLKVNLFYSKQSPVIVSVTTTSTTKTIKTSKAKSTKKKSIQKSPTKSSATLALTFTTPSLLETLKTINFSEKIVLNVYKIKIFNIYYKLLPSRIDVSIKISVFKIKNKFLTQVSSNL